jgi:hypothetical protein
MYKKHAAVTSVDVNLYGLQTKTLWRRHVVGANLEIDIGPANFRDSQTMCTKVFWSILLSNPF